MARKLTMASLFDGSGGFPLASLRAGITPVWASEIEPFPIAVTRQNLTDMVHIGNVNNIDGAKVAPVDIITFGSPCQDLSFAGKRKGLEGTRSGLFYQAIRVIREMREATNGKNPRFAVWENVLGALSSNRGADFASVLSEFLAIVGRRPVARPDDGWRNNGAVICDDCSFAWRVLDARYWGVPQRRRRIFLVADFGGRRAAEILFKRGGTSRNLSESRKEGTTAPRVIEGGVDESVFCLEGNGKRPGHGKGWNDSNVCYTLNTVEQHIVAFFENHGQNACYRDMNDSCQTLVASMGTGGNNLPLVVETSSNDMHLRANINYAATLTATDYKDPPIVYDEFVVRRLTPTECARLQGFPDDWAKVRAIPETEITFWRTVWDGWNAFNHKRLKSDRQLREWMAAPYLEAAEYKMWGNGVALPCVQYIMSNIAETGD